MAQNGEKEHPSSAQAEEALCWTIWVDTERKIVSFHEEAGFQRMAFRNRELYLRCVDEYAFRGYRYQ